MNRTMGPGHDLGVPRTVDARQETGQGVAAQVAEGVGAGLWLRAKVLFAQTLRLLTQKMTELSQTDLEGDRKTYPGRDA